MSHDFQQAVPHNLGKSHNWSAHGSQLIEQLQVRLNDFFFVSKLCPPTHAPPITSPCLDLQFETHKGYIIHHHTMTPKEQRKYHSSIYSGIKVVLENVTISSQYSVPKKHCRMVCQVRTLTDCIKSYISPKTSNSYFI